MTTASSERTAMTNNVPGHHHDDLRAAKRRRHLMDPNAPRPAYDPNADRSLTRVQQWVMSTLAVTTILHLSAGLILAAIFLPNPTRGAEVVLNVIAGAFGGIAVAAALAIHGRRIVSWWLLLGFIPTAVGLWFTRS